MKRKKRLWTKLCSVLAGSCLAFTTALPAYAAPAANPAASLDAKEAERFADAFFKREDVKALNVPGAVFVVVKGDKVLLEKGYGYADLKTKTPVDPRQTAFRIASISKVFTATAVMQLAEQGKIDLDKDVQSYLGDIPLKNKTSSPLTMKHLLTHTSGFDQVDPQGFTFDVNQKTPLEDFTRQNMPNIVQPPGEVYKYDNVASMFQGLIVQKLTKQPFHQYVSEHIFKPLGMNDSSFVPTKELQSRLATGYVDNGDQANQPFPPYQMMPVDMPQGGMVTTGSDMSKFLIAQLNGGKLGNSRILEDKTLKTMQSTQLAIHPELPIMTYGYEFAQQQNGQYVIVKGGTTPDFSSLIWLMPEHKVGGFIVTNKNIDLRGLVFKAFMDHFYPKKESKPRAYLTPSKQELRRFEGLYSDLRIRYLVTRIEAAEDGTLEMKSVLYKKKLRQLDSLLFEDESGGLVAFKENPDGKISYYYSQSLPTAYTAKMPEKEPFADVPDHHPYAEYINGLHQLNIVKGDAGDTFGPDQPMTRAEFLMMFLSWLGISAEKTTARFTDLEGVPGADMIETAALPHYGLVQGNAANRFEPNRPITRQEAAVIVWRFHSKLGTPSKNANMAEGTDPWAEESVKNIVAHKLYGPEVLVTKDGKADYKSKQVMTRQEAAALIYLSSH